MRIKLCYVPFVTFLFVLFASHANAQCCKLPDSLKVKSVDSASFCVKWNRNDTSRCDTAKAWQIRYKRASSTTWKHFNGSYGSAKTYTFCDTVKPCTEYKWEVRNICIHNGDSTFTDWVTGANFTTTCDTTHDSLRIEHLTQAQLHQLKVTPNPAIGLAVISGVFQGKWHVTVSNMTGKKMYETNTTAQGKIRLSLNVSAFEKGVYFITVSDGKDILKTTLIKE